MVTGKTNILEAISMLAPGRGLRSAQLDDMSATGADAGWMVLAEYHHRHRSNAGRCRLREWRDRP